MSPAEAQREARARDSLGVSSSSFGGTGTFPLPASRTRPRSGACLSISVCLATLATLAGATPAAAQAPPLALDRAMPAPAGDPLLFTDSASVRRGLAFGALASYAHAPLISKLTVRDAATGESSETTVVKQQVLTHVQAAYGVGPLLLEAGLPVVVLQGGDDVVRRGRALITKGDGAALGDVRLGVRIAVLTPGRTGLPFGAALGFRVFFPTGDEARYAGTGELRTAPSVSFGGGTDWPWAVSASWLRKRVTVSPRGIAGSEALASAGVARRLGPWQIGIEGFGGTVADGQTDAFASRTTNAELSAVVRREQGPARFTLAAGPGVGLGIGTPAFRAVLGIELFWKDAAPSGTTERLDLGPVVGASAAASASAPPKKATEKDPPNAVVPAAIAATPAQVDRDKDGVVDGSDACPDVAGVASLDAAKNGCPADTDGDGIVDTEDACPRQAGPKQADPKTNGCPEAVRLSATEIVILQQVQFETGSDRIAQESFALLAQVAAAIQGNPDIVRVSVDGHTDDVGQPAKNLVLSQRRAVAVVRWLTEHGVDARRVESRGFGSRRPVVAQKTAEARSKNRRVEFLVKKRDPRGAAAWTDGPVP